VLKWEKTVQSDEREFEKVKTEENKQMNVSLNLAEVFGNNLFVCFVLFFCCFFFLHVNE
jgi:hypothetical protein